MQGRGILTLADVARREHGGELGANNTIVVPRLIEKVVEGENGGGGADRERHDGEERTRWVLGLLQQKRALVQRGGKQ